MSTENPYQSPQSDTRTSEPDDPNRGIDGPTWRFLVLALIGLPTIIYLVIVILSILLESNGPPGQQLIGISIAGSMLLAYVSACLAIPMYWRAAARRRVMPGASSGAAFVQAGIWILALIAAPTAFVTTCTPIGFVAAVSTNAPPAILLGVAVGIFCVFLVGKLAYNLWLDAVGRENGNLLEKIQIPIPRLQARQSESGDAGTTDAQ